VKGKNVFFAAGLFLIMFSLSAVSYALERGKRMPDFGLPASDGEYYTLSGITRISTGAAVFTFFDSKCEPCRKELPLIQKVAKKYAGVNAAFFMVSVGEDRETVGKCIKEWGINFPVIFDETTELAKACDVVTGSLKNIPRTIVVDKYGNVAEIFKGYHADMAEELPKAIEMANASPAPPEKTLRIIYTNSANGVIESCDCPMNPYGGLVRRLTFFEKILLSDIRVSAGDFFSANDESIKNKFTAVIMEKLDYDAIVIGDQEFKTGKDFLMGILQKHSLPIVSANMQVCDGETCFIIGKPYVIKEINGIKIGITGVTSESCFVFYPKKIKERIKFTQTPIEALKSIVPEMRKKCGFVFVIAHVNEREIADIEKVPGIDAVFAGHTQGKFFKPGKPVVMQAGANGRYVGELVMTVSPDGQVSYRNNFYALTPDIKKDKWGLSQNEEYLLQYKKSLEELKKN